MTCTETIIYLIRVAYTTRVISHCLIKRVMLYQLLPVELFLTQPLASTLHLSVFVVVFSSFSDYITISTTKSDLKWIKSQIKITNMKEQYS